MVTRHKISEELYDNSFELIAMHCALECYAMAYYINNTLGLRLSRRREKNEDEEKDEWLESFPIYEWKDKFHDRYWTLVANTVKEENQNEPFGLFSNETTTSAVHLLKERKEVDYFLKIEANNIERMNEIVKKINSIPKVITAYSLDTDTLKSKRNLIF